VSAAETPVKPSILPLKPGLIPEELCSIDAWVGWRLEWVPPSNGKPGRWTKEPIDLRSGGHAKSDDPSTWATFEYAIANYLRRGCDGIGLCRTGDLIFIDWDGVLDETGNLKPFPWAQKTLAAVARRAYLEQSVSRTGLHGICRKAGANMRSEDSSTPGSPSTTRTASLPLRAPFTPRAVRSARSTSHRSTPSCSRPPQPMEPERSTKPPHLWASSPRR